MKQKITGIRKHILAKRKNYMVLGRIYDQKLLGALYALGDAFVICSAWENFPTTCIEAQCCGTPVCGFDRCGTKETALNEAVFKECGLKDTFAVYGDTKALEGIVQTLLSGVIDKKKLSRAAKGRYAKQKMYKAYLGIYKEIMKGQQ